VFKVEFFVDDKRLGHALLALVGIAHGQPSVLPVVNVKKKGNGLAPQTPGNSMDRFAVALKDFEGRTFNAGDVRALMKSLGLAEKSYSYMLQRALAAKLVKKTGKGQGTATRYEVL
jgi:hypothetical protein